MQYLQPALHDMKTSTSMTSTSTSTAISAAVCLLTAALLSACGSGGGGGAPVPEAVVKTVGNAQVAEGNAGTTVLEFPVTLDKPVVTALDVVFNTASTAKAGVDSTGSATGGASCAAGVDFISAVNSRLSLPVGASTGKLTVVLCADTTFEPTETLKVNWTSAGSAGGSVIGTIVNDDMGGLNGGGAVSGLNGLPAFGRDTNALTNSAADGALGFAFEKKESAMAWNCTYDQVTGLTWQRLDAAGGRNKSFASLSAYVTSVNAAQPCGHADWRVPTVNELVSLMDSSQPASVSPNADRDGTADAMTGQYWSSEANASASNNAWLVDTDNGGAVSFDAKTNLKNVRLVQGTANPAVCSNASGQYRDFGDGTVGDSKTGLMWKQCAEGLSGSSCSTGAAMAVDSIAAIVSRVNAVNADASTSGAGLGYSDWRVPNRGELASLVNRSCTASPAIVTSVFPATGTVSYFSATNDANDISRLWYVDFTDGSIAPGRPAISKLLRLVRAGQ